MIKRFYPFLIVFGENCFYIFSGCRIVLVEPHMMLCPVEDLDEYIFIIGRPTDIRQVTVFAKIGNIYVNS